MIKITMLICFASDYIIMLFDVKISLRFQKFQCQFFDFVLTFLIEIIVIIVILNQNHQCWSSYTDRRTDIGSERNIDIGEIFFLTDRW